MLRGPAHRGRWPPTAASAHETRAAAARRRAPTTVVLGSLAFGDPDLAAPIALAACAASPTVDDRVALAIDLGGTELRAALVDDGGAIARLRGGADAGG